MHTVVEFIPFLLHLSLLFFFGGLVAFLLPINRALMVGVAALLCLISTTYIYLTLLPILSSNSPYRTPMTSVAWEILQRASALVCPRKKRSSSDKESSAPGDKHRWLDERIPTMVEVMVLDAMAESSKRHTRDSRAIVWTVRSLTDNNELESFVDALPTSFGDQMGGDERTIRLSLCFWTARMSNWYLGLRASFRAATAVFCIQTSKSGAEFIASKLCGQLLIS
jgi:hypothetical protein